MDLVDDEGEQGEKGDDRPDRAALDREPRQIDAAHREIGVRQGLKRLPDGRQRAGQRDPEEQLQHERRVARDLDISRDQPVEQRIAGGAQEAERHAEDGRERAAGDRELQRVEEADENRAGVGVAGAVDDQRFRDVEVRRLRQVVEARRHAEPVHALQDVRGENREDERPPRRGRRLARARDRPTSAETTRGPVSSAGGGSARASVIEIVGLVFRADVRRARGARRRGPATRSSVSGRAASTRSPPWVQSRFRPRSKPILVDLPRLRSKISP